MDDEKVDLTPEVERAVEEMNDDQALAFFHEVDKLAKTLSIEKERVAVLNDRFDIYVLEPPPPGAVVVVARNPGPRRSLVVKVSDGRPNPQSASQDAATALGVRLVSIHVF